MSKTLTVFLLCLLAFQVSALRMTHTEETGPLTIEAGSVPAVPAVADALENADKSVTELRVVIAGVDVFLTQGTIVLTQYAIVDFQSPVYSVL